MLYALRGLLQLDLKCIEPILYFMIFLILLTIQTLSWIKLDHVQTPSQTLVSSMHLQQDRLVPMHKRRKSILYRGLNVLLEFMLYEYSSCKMLLNRKLSSVLSTLKTVL